jgi:GTP-binding protein HflX
LQQLANRRIKSPRIVDPEVARALTEISHLIERQVGMLVDRKGHVAVVLVGDARGVFIPDLSAYRQGRDRLCGLRLVHTHLKHEPLSDDDLTDLAVLRLDAIAAIEVLDDGLPGKVHVAHLMPGNADNTPWELHAPRPVHDLPADYPEMISALEEEFARNRKPRLAGDTRTRAILAHVGTESVTDARDSLSELADLAQSAGLDTIDTILQRRPIDPKYVLGLGKLKQVIIRAMQLGAETLVFDLNLTPGQILAVANFTDLKILDRTQLILDIFAQHATAREGKLQVELAQLRYMLPRLSEKHTAMSRLTGGIGGRGPGETKLEVDKRRATDRIAMLDREVAKLGDRRRLRRNLRTERGLATVSIVGYTNAGKSSLLNSLTASSVVSENALFATLNPVSRRLRFPRDREIIMTDTVGFIRNLPKELMAAFRTTLEEIDDADLLLHVVDASRPDVDDLIETVRNILRDLGLDRKPLIMVLNKMDICNAAELAGLAARYNGIPVCAFDPTTFGPLMKAMEQSLWSSNYALAVS